MAKVTIGIAVLLIAVGLIGYFESFARTSLIPAYFGIGILIAGVIALNPAYRKHAMHGAVMLGLLGFLAAAGRLVNVLFSGAMPSALGLFSLVSMALLTLIFVVLCVRSFIEARRSRTQSPR